MLPVTFSVVSLHHTTTLNEILQRYISDYLKYGVLKKEPLRELNRTSQILQNRLANSFSNKSAEKKSENCLEMNIFTGIFQGFCQV